VRDEGRPSEPAYRSRFQITLRCAGLRAPGVSGKEKVPRDGSDENHEDE